MSKRKPTRPARPTARASHSTDEAEVTDVQQVATPIRQTGRTTATTAETAAQKKKSHGRIKVRATRDGYYDDKYIRAGDVFTIDAEPLRSVLRRERHAPAAKGLDPEGLDQPAAFSDKWMERVGKETPEQITSHNEALRRQHDEELAARSASRTSAAAEEENPLEAD